MRLVAREAMDEAERAAPTTAVASLLNPVRRSGARLLLAQGDVAAAAAGRRNAASRLTMSR